MKRILTVLATAILVVSCGVQGHQRIVSIGFVDYRPYTSAGIFLSPNPCNQEFEPIGELYIEVIPALKRAENDSKGFYTDDIYSVKTMVPENIDASELLEIAVKKAGEMGANGISNLEIKVIRNAANQIDRYEISGFCIKIL
jgi:hypothetical protein